MAIKMDKREELDIYLSLGSNMGDRMQNIENAISLLEDQYGEITIKSSLYRTEAWGNDSLDWFYNQVVGFKSNCLGKELLKSCLEIEKRLGRVRKDSLNYQNRLIDIDILMIGDKIIDQKNLHVPHSKLHLRNFVLYPFAEISPDIEHPRFSKTLIELKINCKDDNLIEKME